jgi:hypothetical protein
MGVQFFSTGNSKDNPLYHATKRDVDKLNKIEQISKAKSSQIGNQKIALEQEPYTITQDTPIAIQEPVKREENPIQVNKQNNANTIILNKESIPIEKSKYSKIADGNLFKIRNSLRVYYANAVIIDMGKYGKSSVKYEIYNGHKINGKNELFLFAEIFQNGEMSFRFNPTSTANSLKFNGVVDLKMNEDLLRWVYNKTYEILNKTSEREIKFNTSFVEESLAKNEFEGVQP